jgi:hypothetical protein
LAFRLQLGQADENGPDLVCELLQWQAEVEVGSANHIGRYAPPVS